MKAVPTAGDSQMKLLLDTRSRHVLYAKARKDAVDFLITRAWLRAAGNRQTWRRDRRAVGTRRTFWSRLRDSVPRETDERDAVRVYRQAEQEAQVGRI